MHGDVIPALQLIINLSIRDSGEAERGRFDTRASLEMIAVSLTMLPPYINHP
jgi:hypothetical protein